VEDVQYVFFVVILHDNQSREGGDVHLLGDALGKIGDKGEVESQEEMDAELLDH
jgi:hypothetical protein